MLKVIVAGGRNFNDYNMLEQALDYFLQNHRNDVYILCGMAHGADILGYAYAQKHGYKVEEHPAKWDVHGKRAGFMRNEEMAKNADALIAFWDGKSHGTKDMIRRAREHGLDIRVIRYGK